MRKCGGGKISLKADEKQIFAVHNRGRRDHKLRPLCVHPEPLAGLRSHSKDMIWRDYFSHVSHDTKGRNESSRERVRRFGYRYLFIARRT